MAASVEDIANQAFRAAGLPIRVNDYFEGSVHQAVKFLRELLEGVFGLTLEDAAPASLALEEEALLTERVEARKAKNWKRSDEIRDLLENALIALDAGEVICTG